MKVNSNTAEGPNTHVVDLLDEMELFDRLSPSARHAINYANGDYGVMQPVKYSLLERSSVAAINAKADAARKEAYYKAAENGFRPPVKTTKAVI